jgi:hypothetical protein
VILLFKPYWHVWSYVRTDYCEQYTIALCYTVHALDAVLLYTKLQCVHAYCSVCMHALPTTNHSVYSVDAYTTVKYMYMCILPLQCLHAYLLLYGAIGSTNHSGHFHPLSFPLVTPISTSPVLASPCCSGSGGGACMHAAYHVEVSVTVSLCAFTYHALRIGTTGSLCRQAMLEITELFTECQLFAAANKCHVTVLLHQESIRTRYYFSFHLLLDNYILHFLIQLVAKPTCTPSTPCAAAPAAAFCMTPLDTCFVDSRRLSALVSNFALVVLVDTSAALVEGFTAMCSCECLLLLLLLLLLMLCKLLRKLLICV